MYINLWVTSDVQFRKGAIIPLFGWSLAGLTKNKALQKMSPFSFSLCVRISSESMPRAVFEYEGRGSVGGAGCWSERVEGTVGRGSGLAVWFRARPVWMCMCVELCRCVCVHYG
jgi:hypothetical protein